MTSGGNRAALPPAGEIPRQGQREGETAGEGGEVDQHLAKRDRNTNVIMQLRTVEGC